MKVVKIFLFVLVGLGLALQTSAAPISPDAAVDGVNIHQFTNQAVITTLDTSSEPSPIYTPDYFYFAGEPYTLAAGENRRSFIAAQENLRRIAGARSATRVVMRGGRIFLVRAA